MKELRISYETVIKKVTKELRISYETVTEKVTKKVTKIFTKKVTKKNFKNFAKNYWNKSRKNNVLTQSSPSSFLAWHMYSPPSPSRAFRMSS